MARAHGYDGPMAKLPREWAAAICLADYWTGPGLDMVAAVAPKVAAELFDTGVNMGVGAAASFLRRALNALNRNASDYPDITPAGAIVAALRAFLHKRGAGGAVVLVKTLDALQGARYVALAESRPANEAFLYGWLANRIG